MSKKKIIIYILVTVIVGTIVFLIINNFIGKEDINKNSDSNSNVIETTEKQTITIDYKMYQELRSEVYENETFAIVLMNSEDEVSKTFKEEILYSFKERDRSHRRNPRRHRPDSYRRPSNVYGEHHRRFHRDGRDRPHPEGCEHG